MILCLQEDSGNAVLAKPFIYMKKGCVEMSEKKDVLEQKNKYKWRDNPPKGLTREEMVEAFACAADADNLKCDCWNTSCPYFGDCKKCLVFHLCLKQLPTCQRDLIEELYVAKPPENTAG